MSATRNVFPPQVMTEDQENTVIRNNMLIDWALGHRELVDQFAQMHQEFGPYASHISCLSEEEIKAQACKARNNSLLMTVLMLTGNCNANCEVCYTDRKARPIGLNIDEIRSILDQTHALGSSLVYLPGEGEPTLDAAFWDLLEYATKLGMRVIVFTNGIILSDDSQALRQWSITGVEALRRLAEYPVYIYYKLWSLQPEKHSSLMGIQKESFNWTDLSVNGGKYSVPSGLVRMLKHLPKERVGVQVLAERRNYEEITQRIIPFIQELGIKSYIEPVLHSGRMQCRSDYDLSESESRSLDGLLSRTTCKRVAYKIVVHNDGTLSPGMAFNPNDLDSVECRRAGYSIRDQEAGGVRDIFSMIHRLRFMVWARYQIDGCLCERANRWISGLEQPPQTVPIEHFACNKNRGEA